MGLPDLQTAMKMLSYVQMSLRLLHHARMIDLTTRTNPKGVACPKKAPEQPLNPAL